MALDLTFTCPLANGVHARPASALEEVARGFTADVALLNERTGQIADAKSILSIVAADIRFRDACRLRISGGDEDRAMAALGTFIREAFAGCDEPLPGAAAPPGETLLPPMLRNAEAVLRRGTPVVLGIGQGRLVHARAFRIPSRLPMDGVRDPDAELARIDQGLKELLSWYEQRIAALGKCIESELLGAHRSLARDVEFRRVLAQAVKEEGRTAAGAISDAEAHFSAVFAASNNLLLRERTLDIQDVCRQLLQLVYGSEGEMGKVVLEQDSVIFGDSLTPGQFLALNRRFLKGLVLADGGTTSHTIILARSFGVPTLVGVQDLPGASAKNCEAVVDADLGALVTDLTPAARRYYAMEQRRLAGRRDRLQRFARQSAATRDGHRIEVAANIATLEEAAPAFEAGAEGIGLFRTEMLFLDRHSAPSEEEQLRIFRGVLEAAGGRPVIFRTLDIGGDKPLEYLKLPREANPFMGYRALRIYPEFESLFRTHVRALVRASGTGKTRVMLPMVATVEEVRWAKTIIAGEQAACAAAGQPFDQALPIGAMIEVPSAAFIMPELVREVDFFSIGSNDLLQYFMAADRTNSRVAALYDPLQPAFLRLLQTIVETARRHKRWIGLCGEMGGQARLLPLLAGLDLDEISATAPAIPALKAGLADFDRSECRELLRAAAGAATAGDVGRLLNDFVARNQVPLLSPDLIVCDAGAETKEEAIKQTIDLLYVHGRLERSRDVEEAVWQREAAYSTGFGHGFAIPHCKSAAVQHNSLVLLKLRSPVHWGSLDDQPVRVVLLLVIRDTDGADAHMKVFARLARQVMHEDFRATLEREKDSAALCAFLHEKLGIQPGRLRGGRDETKLGTLADTRCS